MIPNVIVLITAGTFVPEATPTATDSPGWAPANPAGMLGQFLMLALVFVGVVVLAYFCTKWLGTAKQTRRGANLSVLESMGMGQQSAIQIIRVGSKFFLVGITKEHVTLLSELDEESLVLPEARTINLQGTPTFAQAFELQLRKYFHKERRPDQEVRPYEQNQDQEQDQNQERDQALQNDITKDKH